jgi:hypothetical protein
MDESELKSVLAEWQRLILSRRGIERECEVRILDTFRSKPIKIITGFRRSGKSFLTQRLAQKCIHNNLYTINNILYLNFEDFRLSDITTDRDLLRVIDIFTSEICESGPRLYIFDEIQHVAGWDKLIRTIYELHENVEIVITGSNSELLSSELGSNLAGRFIEFFVFPFSFREFLLYRDALVTDRKELLREHDTLLKRFFEYLHFGGLPEVFDIGTEEAKRSYLNGIISKVILDDIVKRYNVDRIEILERIIGFLFSNVGNVVTYTKIAGRFNAEKIKIKSDTVSNYISFLMQAFALFDLKKYDWKLRKYFTFQKKYYSIDTGLIGIYRPIHENIPYKLENCVFLHLMRTHPDIFFGRDEKGREIDFLIRKEEFMHTRIQVCYELTSSNYTRETDSFSIASPWFGRGENILLYLRNNLQQKDEQKGKSGFQLTSLLQWLLFDVP